jgi:hypothetical protein
MSAPIPAKQYVDFIVEGLERLPDFHLIPTHWAVNDETIFVEARNTATVNDQPIVWPATHVVALRKDMVVRGPAHYDPERGACLPGTYCQGVPVIAGVGAMTTVESMRLAQHAEAHGVCGVFVVPMRILATPVLCLVNSRHNPGGRFGRSQLFSDTHCPVILARVTAARERIPLSLAVQDTGFLARQTRAVMTKHFLRAEPLCPRWIIHRTS